MPDTFTREDAALLSLVASLRRLDEADDVEGAAADLLPLRSAARAQAEAVIAARHPHRDALLRAIVNLPAVTPEGIAAKAGVAAGWYGPDLSGLSPAEAVGAALLRELAGADSLPSGV